MRGGAQAQLPRTKLGFFNKFKTAVKRFVPKKKTALPDVAPAIPQKPAHLLPPRPAYPLPSPDKESVRKTPFTAQMLKTIGYQPQTKTNNPNMKIVSIGNHKVIVHESMNEPHVRQIIQNYHNQMQSTHNNNHKSNLREKFFTALRNPAKKTSPTPPSRSSSLTNTTLTSFARQPGNSLPNLSPAQAQERLRLLSQQSIAYNAAAISGQNVASVSQRLRNAESNAEHAEPESTA